MLHPPETYSFLSQSLSFYSFFPGVSQSAATLIQCI